MLLQYQYFSIHTSVYITYIYQLNLNFWFCLLSSSRLSSKVKEAPRSYEQKKQVHCIWLSDSSSEKVAADVTYLYLLISDRLQGEEKGVGSSV